jgi:hypothetical protein
MPTFGPTSLFFSFSECSSAIGPSRGDGLGRGWAGYSGGECRIRTNKNGRHLPEPHRVGTRWTTAQGVKLSVSDRFGNYSGPCLEDFASICRHPNLLSDGLQNQKFASTRSKASDSYTGSYRLLRSASLRCNQDTSEWTAALAGATPFKIGPTSTASGSLARKR